MVEVLAITFPIYLIIALGFAVVKGGLVSVEDIRALGRVVIGIFIPATLFVNISRVPVAEAMRWDFVVGYLAGSLTIFAVGTLFAAKVLRQSRQVAVLQGLGMSSSNSGFMGFPIVAMVLGDVAVQALAMAMLVENVVMIPLAMLLADGGRGQSLLQNTLRPVLSNPILIAVVAALALSASGLALPGAMERTLEILAPVGPPVALVAVGGIVAALSFAPIKGPVAAVVAGKLVLHPLAVLVALTLSGSLPQDLVLAGVLFASVPMMSIYALFGQRWGAESFAASALILTTVLSFLTVSAILWLTSSPA
ncbi:AEC family transporter [Fuscovulum ytuae]|uniref:AEC family transporter n=1 Tax=Fuscovulum ytuae TaxID=3042299 RepID=A0ABY8Q3U2_9RHOB|nr:AEC family transporter [Fuscovulum sp. YMD61]WGV15025.1 AEC family transporter [Fuscovulum sp. YMD61]